MNIENKIIAGKLIKDENGTYEIVSVPRSEIDFVLYLPETYKNNSYKQR